jgi:hypothetical protein
MKRVSYRPPTAWAFAISVWVLTLGVLSAELYIGFNPQALLVAVLICFAAYLMFLRPRLVVDEEGIEIINPFVSYQIAWQSIEVIDAKFSFFVQVNGRKIHSFAAVASGRYANLKPGGLRPFGGFFGHRVESTEIANTGISVEDNSIRAVESPRTDTGAALALARHYHARSKPSTSATNDIKVDYFSIMVCVALALTATVL